MQKVSQYPTFKQSVVLLLERFIWRRGCWLDNSVSKLVDAGWLDVQPTQKAGYLKVVPKD